MGRCAADVIRGQPLLPALCSGHVGRILRCILEIVSPFKERTETGIELNERVNGDVHTHTRMHRWMCGVHTCAHIGCRMLKAVGEKEETADTACGPLMEKPVLG